MLLSLPPRRGRNIRPCLVVLPADLVSCDVSPLGILVQAASTIPTRHNRYKLPTARQLRHVLLLWQTPYTHPRTARAHAYQYLSPRTPRLRIRPHSGRQKMSKYRAVNRYRVESVTQYRLSRFHIPSGASQSPILMLPVLLITLRSTKITLSPRIEPPRRRRICPLLSVWRSHFSLQCRRRVPFSWRFRSLSRCRLRSRVSIVLRRQQAHQFP